MFHVWPDVFHIIWQHTHFLQWLLCTACCCNICWVCKIPDRISPQSQVVCMCCGRRWEFHTSNVSISALRVCVLIIRGRLWGRSIPWTGPFPHVLQHRVSAGFWTVGGKWIKCTQVQRAVTIISRLVIRAFDKISLGIFAREGDKKEVKTLFPLFHWNVFFSPILQRVAGLHYWRWLISQSLIYLLEQSRWRPQGWQLFHYMCFISQNVT